MRFKQIFSALTLLCAPWIANAAAPSATFGITEPSAASALRFPALDRDKLAREDAAASKLGTPYRYGVGRKVDGVSIAGDKSLGGEWTLLADGRSLWRQKVVSDGAKSLDFGFTRFRMPQGAELWISSGAKGDVQGPYTDQHNQASGQLWTAMVAGESATIELIVPSAARAFVELKLGYVNHGYRDAFEREIDKSGSCNVDTVCPQGDAWRDQIRSVGAYSFSAGSGQTPNSFSCTGTLMNRSSGDRAPLFLTASHCLSTQAQAATVVVYWNYASSTCRAVGSAANGVQVPVPSGLPSNSGTTLVSNFSTTDMTLLRLNTAPPAVANVYWAGWDRRDIAPDNATTIHHASGHEKRISFEQQPLNISGYLQCAAGQSCPAVTPPSVTSHLRVNQWDVGTTEPGSSGSPLFNAQKRVVGQLNGGYAACNDTRPDWYGRVATSWAGGGSSSSRLSDHFDDTASAAQFLDGTASCAAPTASLSASSDPVIAGGTDATFTVAATGGAGNYTYLWDIDGDGVVDRTTTTNSLVARYDRERQFNVSVRVRDGAACETVAQRAVNVVAHRVKVDTVVSAPVQVCGDGDAVIEPGERWRIAANLVNDGSRPTTANAIGVFTKTATDAVSSAPRDSFGYAVIDSTDGAQCGYQFVDITDAVSALPLIASGSVAATDDGRTGVLDLSGTNAFNFYGQNVTQAVMSTNGYLGTSAATTGGDFNNVCGSPPDSDNNGPRLQALHDDLVAGSLRAATFASCPRQADVGPANQRCLVFQWNNMGLYTSSTGAPTGNFDFQIVVYPSTFQIAYQYRNAVPNGGNGATIGILNPATTGQQLNFACNQSAIAGNQAVCFFHPQNLPAATGDLTKLRLESPVSALGVIAAAGTAQASTIFSVDPTTACGSRFRVGFAGAADANSGSFGYQSREFLVGDEANCQVITTCPLALAPTVNLRPGAFFNPNRPGNGLISHVTPIAGGRPVYFGAWYTGTPSRTPTWYVVQGVVQDNQVIAPILKFTRNIGAPTFDVDSETVGRAVVHFLTNESLFYNFTFSADGAANSELMVHGFQGINTGTPNRTGAWYHPAEEGWGATYDSYSTGTAREFVASYFYDAVGQPRWVLGDTPATTTVDFPVQTYSVQCPVCAWTPFLDSAQAAGSMRRNFTTPTTGTLTTGFTLPAPMVGTWNRSAVPINLLTPPQP